MGAVAASVWCLRDAGSGEIVTGSAASFRTERGNARDSAGREVASAATITPTAEQNEARTRHKPDRVNSLTRLQLDGRTRGRISKPVIEDFLTRSERSPGSLLTAFRESGDRAYLEEAVATYPNDPRVQFAMITDLEASAERDKWIAAFQKSAPENALADYFAAHAAYQRKDGSLAFEELAKAATKDVFSDYLWNVADELEGLYLAGGLPAAEAKAMSMASIPLPHLAQMRNLGDEMQIAQKALRAAGDNARADELLVANLQLGRTLGDEPASTVIHRLVGFAIECRAIESAPPAAASAVLGMSATERLAEIQAVREEILQNAKAVDITSAPVSDDEIVRYFEMVRAEGELAALKWLGEQTRAR